MACRAILGCRGMIGDLAEGSDAVVAALTVRHEAGVVEARRTPGQGGMAVAAICRRDEVVQGLCGSLDTVVADRALVFLQQIRVLHPGRHERYGRMAAGAVIIRKDVLEVFPGGDHAVVATTTGSLRPGVIHAEDGHEGVA